MDVDEAKIREEAKAILKEITDPSPDPKKEQIEIWEAWFDRIADSTVSQVCRTPTEAAGEDVTDPFPLDLIPP
jgi:hypothetical protein